MDILIVDDEPQIRDVLGRILDSAEHGVTLASNGQEAIRELGMHPYSLVISDILMPALDGLELLNYIRKERPEIPLIAMSGTGNLIYLRSASKLGAVDVLEKPFTRERVLELVGRVLGSTS